MTCAADLDHPLHALSRELLGACATLARTRDPTDAAAWRPKAQLALHLAFRLAELAEEEAGHPRVGDRAPPPRLICSGGATPG
jgi:hypothetical protein